MRRIGTGRLLGRYLLAQRTVLALVAAVVAMLAFFATVAPAVVQSLLTQAQRHELAEMVPHTRDLVGDQQVTPPDSLAADDWAQMRERLEQARAEMPPLLRSLTARASFTVDGVTRQAVSDPPQADRWMLTTSISPDAFDHLRIVDGTLPEPAGSNRPIDMILSAPVAEAMRWQVGEARVLTGSSLPDRRYRLSGTYEALDPQGSFWRHTAGAVDPTVVTEGLSTTVFGTAWVSSENLAGLGPLSAWGAKTQVWFPLEASEATSAQTGQLIDDLAAFTRKAVRLSEENAAGSEAPWYAAHGVELGFATQTTQVLRDAQTTASSLVSLTALFAAGPAAAALCVLVLATGLVRSRSASLLVLARARGASRLQSGAGAAVVAGIIGVPAAALGAAAAAVVSPAEGGVLWWPAAVCALLPVVTFVVSATRLDDRPPRLPRLSVELTLAVLAAVAVVAVIQRGADAGLDRVDPLLVAAPVLVCLTAATVARRLLPQIAGFVTAWQARRTGLVGLLGAARTRHDSVSASAVVALVTALGIAAFAASTVATLDDGRHTTAASRAGADLRIDADLQADADALDPAAVDALSALPQVQETTTLVRGPKVAAQAGSTSYAVLVLTDAEALAAVQRDAPGALPGVGALAEGDDADGVPVVLSADLAERIDVTAGAELEVDGDRVHAAGVGGDRLPGIADRFWVLVDRDSWDPVAYAQVAVALASLDGDADGGLIAEVQDLFPQADVTSPGHESAVLDDDPSVGGVHLMALVSVIVSLLLVAVAVVLALVAGAGARARDLAIVRAMGLAARRARRLPLWEIGLLVVTAAVLAACVGVLLPWVLLGAVDVRPFTGGDAQPDVVLPWTWWMLGGLTLLAVTALGALLAAAGAARHDLTDTLRTMEE